MEDATLVRDFATIMAVAGIAIVIFQWLKQPPVLGYLLAGLIVGPYTLPLLNLPTPVTDTDSIHLMAELGFIMLLFAIGLEFGWRRIREMGLRVILIGTIEIFFMIALGYEGGDPSWLEHHRGDIPRRGALYQQLRHHHQGAAGHRTAERAAWRLNCGRPRSRGLRSGHSAQRPIRRGDLRHRKPWRSPDPHGAAGSLLRMRPVHRCADRPRASSGSWRASSRER